MIDLAGAQRSRRLVNHVDALRVVFTEVVAFLMDYDHLWTPGELEAFAISAFFVSCNWRRAALQSPKLWSTIRFTSALDARRGWPRQQQWLKRSATEPLSIQITTSTFSDRLHAQATMAKICAVILPHGHRFVKVHLAAGYTGSPSVPYEAAHTICGVLEGIQLPQVRLISLSAEPDPKERDRLMPGFNVGPTPHLTHLELHYIPARFSSSTLDNIRVLTITDRRFLHQRTEVNWFALWRLISHMPHLEHLAVLLEQDHKLKARKWPLAPLDHIGYTALPQLRTLSVSEAVGDVIQWFLQFVKMPRLQTVHYEHMDYDFSIMTIPDLINNPLRCLKHLSLRGWARDEGRETSTNYTDSLPLVLSDLYSVEKLSFYNFDFWNDGLLPFLEDRCPKLRLLEIFGCSSYTLGGWHRVVMARELVGLTSLQTIIFTKLPRAWSNMDDDDRKEILTPFLTSMEDLPEEEEEALEGLKNAIDVHIVWN